jgi:hypothetical protein
MSYAILAFAFALCLGAFTYWALPRGPHNRFLVIPYVLMVLMVFSVVVDILGTSKPMALEWRSHDRARVVGLHFDREQRLASLWILRGGEPYAYVMPYPDEEEAETVARKWRNREMSGEKFFTDSEGEITVEAPEELPPK